MTEYDRGYRDGLWFGTVNTYGQLVVEAFPADTILPGYTIPEMMRIAMELKKEEIQKFLTPQQVFIKMQTALQEKKGLSLVRLGDGEGIALAQGFLKSEEEVKKYDFLEYAGLTPPDYAARDQLADAVRNADIVGIPSNLMPDFQPLVCKALQRNGISTKDLTLTDATINSYLYQTGYFQQLIEQPEIKVILVGNKAPELANILRPSCSITGVIAPVEGVNDVPRVFAELENYKFDLLLVAAGIPAVLICSRAAKKYNCVAFDMGHLADHIIKLQKD